MFYREEKAAEVSIIIPARNAAKTIAEALQSVLPQSRVAEVIIVDDKSTDGTREVVSNFLDSRITVLQGAGSGIANALNLALDHASAEYVARCDADDRYPAGRLGWQTCFLDENADYIGVSGGFRSISARGRPVAMLATEGVPRDVTDDLKVGRAITHFCAHLVRRQPLLRAGGAREWFVTAEDADLMYRLASIGRVWHDPRVAYDYRLHDASIVHTQSDRQRLFFEMAAVEFAQQRLRTGTDDLEAGTPPSVPDNAGKVTSARTQIAQHLRGQAWSAFGRGQRSQAIWLIARSIGNRPFSVASWRSLALFALRSSA